MACVDTKGTSEGWTSGGGGGGSGSGSGAFEPDSGQLRLFVGSIELGLPPLRRF